MCGLSQTPTYIQAQLFSHHSLGRYGFSVLSSSLQSLTTKAILQPAKATAMCKVPHAETRPPPLFATVMLLCFACEKPLQF